MKIISLFLLLNEQELQYCQTVVLSVKDEAGLQTIIDELLPALRDKNPGMRRASATMIHVFCSRTKCDFSQYISLLLRALIAAYKDEEKMVLEAACEALGAVTKVRVSPFDGEWGWQWGK